MAKLDFDTGRGGATIPPPEEGSPANFRPEESEHGPQLL
jgi:hypothetical protein